MKVEIEVKTIQDLLAVAADIEAKVCSSPFWYLAADRPEIEELRRTLSALKAELFKGL